MATETLASANAFAAAVAAKLAGNDAGVARKTEEFLSEQTALLKVQKEHLKDEHAARLHFLQGQAREVDIRRFGLRLRVAFQRQDRGGGPARCLDANPALAKYDGALKYAPNWKELKDVREALTKHAG